MRKFFATLIALPAFFMVSAQATHSFTDSEKKYKEVKELIQREDYALAYTGVSELKKMYPENDASNHAYINDDVNYFYILCGLKLMQDISADEAEEYIATGTNEARKQQLSFHLAHYYFQKNEFSRAVNYFNLAGVEQLSNDQIADAKFEKAYALFTLKRFAEAKPLFNEIHQLPTNKYYLPANYYYGFVSYYDKDYAEALTAFQRVETHEEYGKVVPYYIAEIQYFLGDKETALQQAVAALQKGQSAYYDKQLRLLAGQLYFEKKDYARALPLLEQYVNGSDKVSKEVLYELSYCYYMQKQPYKAIEGFKQLSNERDSMGQNSMYLLGGLYLETNQKANARNAFQYSAYNSSNEKQQRISRFNYAKLSYELGYQDVALKEMKAYLNDYPGAENENEAIEILVSLLTNTSNYNEALQLYNSLKNPSPAVQNLYPRILYGKAIEYFNDQQLGQADELFSKIMAHPQAAGLLPYAQFWKGEIAYRQQQYDAAIRYLTAFLQSNAAAQGEATPVAARYNLGYSYFQKENYQQALTQFELVTKNIHASSSALEQDAYLRSADAYFMLKNYGQANMQYEKLYNLSLPQSEYALYQRAVIAGIKSSAEKIRLLNALVRQYPSGSLTQEVNLEIAKTYLSDEKFSEAVPYLDRVLVSSNEALKPTALAQKGLAFYNANNNKEALAAYRELIQKYPQSADVHEALANIKEIYVEEGKPGEYIEFMRANGKTVSAGEAEELLYNAALLKYNQKNCEAALQSFKQYNTAYPQGTHSTEISFMRAECLQEAKNWKEAAEAYEVVNKAGLSRFYEKATLEAARIFYFELKDYNAAKKYFAQLREKSADQATILEALRGLVRSHYLLKDYEGANTVSKELLTKKGISTDDKAIAYLVLGKSLQTAGDCAGAITAFKNCAAMNKSSWGAEARFELANCQFLQNNLGAAEKSAMAVIKETGSYDGWVTRAYILLGDIFMKQKDYFNAKATYESVAKNASIASLKAEARQKYEQAVEAEKQGSKLLN